MKIFYTLGRTFVRGLNNRAQDGSSLGLSRVLLPLMTALAVAWFLVRVIPKPVRATYPCQQAAFPLLSATVVWLLGLKASFLAWLRINKRARQLRYFLPGAALMLIIGLIGWAAEKFPQASPPGPLALTYGSPSGDPPNSPVGTAKGILPGRVTWMRDTNATPWNGRTGYWWQDTNGVNQAAVDRMISWNLRALTGVGSDTAAWDRIFRHYNVVHERGDIGYSSNEIVAIKINLNNLRTYENNNYSDASKQTVLALLRQLVNKAGVPQTNIAIYDAVRTLPSWIHYPCWKEFPGVQWYSGDGYPNVSNVWRTTWVTNSSRYSVSNACGGPLVVPRCVSEATYLINMPLLKGHYDAGVTLAAKNHYGSIPAREHGVYLTAWRTNSPLYSMLVDLMGSRQLGGKTILYVNDALFGNVSNDTPTPNSLANCSFSNLFNGQWSASIFMSLDPVAIDSVGVDFLYAEFGSRLGQTPSYHQLLATNCDHYLHEAASADHPPSGTAYQPDSVPFSSLGVHEHWNNPIDKQYSRNLDTNGTGIELVALHQIPPAVLTITSPTNTEAIAATNAVLTAEAVTNYSAITRVDFYANSSLIGTVANAPFGFTWTNPAWGHWALQAIGTDLDGYCTTSAVVEVDIGFSIAITNPPSGFVLLEDANLPIQARIVSAFGPVTQADFSANDLLLGSRAGSPFEITWTNVPVGNWALRVAASDTAGTAVTSAVVNVEARRDIRIALLQPVSGAVFLPGDVTLQARASSALTQILRVEFYANGSLIATVSNTPYVAVWTNPPPGAWSLTAVATETGGYSASCPAAGITIKPGGIRTAGTLYVDLRGTNSALDGTLWTNLGALGDFTAVVPPIFRTNAAGTGLPACEFKGPNYLTGPLPGPDLEGSSDRSLEIWLFCQGVSTPSAIMIWGWTNQAFAARYESGSCGAFSTSRYSSPYSIGWPSSAPRPGQWHHFLYAYDGATNMSVYVDGALQAAKAFPTPLSTGPSSGVGMLLGRADFGTDGWIYFMGFINSVRVHGGLLSSNDAQLNYLAGPCAWNTGPISIAEQPQDLRAAEGTNAVFSVTAADPAPLSFQWFCNGIPIPGATNATCVFRPLRWTDNGSQFCCLISRSYDRTSCTAATRLAQLTVTPLLPVFTSCVASNGQLALRFTAVIGANYQLQYKDRLEDPTWTPVGASQPASSATVEITDCIGTQSRFYRVTRAL